MAIKQGYDAREQVATVIQKEISDLLSIPQLREPVELLGTLIKLSILNLKIATARNPKHCFTRKLVLLSIAMV